MKFYSDVTKKLYETEDALKEAEVEREKEEAELAKKKAAEEAEREAKKEARKARAAEIDEARKTMVDAQRHYQKLLGDFIHDYGSYHTTLTPEKPLWKDFFELIF